MKQNKKNKGKLAVILAFSLISSLAQMPVMAQEYDRVKGFDNKNASIAVEQIARYDSGMTDADGGVMEIVDYNKKNGWAYAINGKAGVLTAIPIKVLEEKSGVSLLEGKERMSLVRYMMWRYLTLMSRTIPMSTG